jgi:hypothetical protein
MGVRQAGFSTVLCVSETFANDLLTAAFTAADAQRTFSLTSPVMVGGAPVTISGPMRVLPPTVTLQTRADNLIGVRARFTGELTLTSAVAPPTDVEVAFGASLDVGIAVTRVSDRFFVGVDLTSATVTAADFRVVAGQLVSVYGNALSGSPILSSLTNALRAIPPALTQLTPNGVAATSHIAPEMMPCGASLFDPPPLFDAAITVNRVVPRPIDGALVVGVDINGTGTVGDPGALMNLLKQPGPPIEITTSDVEGPSDRSFGRAVVGGSSVAVSVNPRALSNLIANVLTRPLTTRSSTAMWRWRISVCRSGSSSRR